MRFKLFNLVHLRRGMWDIDNVQLMYSDNVGYLSRYWPINIIFACNERALWVGPDYGVDPTDEAITCLTCLVWSNGVHQTA